MVADHGVSLWPGEEPRDASDFRLPDVLGIPLIFKLPDKSAGAYRSILCRRSTFTFHPRLPRRCDSAALAGQVVDAVHSECSTG
jgi:hypothetical protein